jgi:hypothetical protein
VRKILDTTVQLAGKVDWAWIDDEMAPLYDLLLCFHEAESS